MASSGFRAEGFVVGYGSGFRVGPITATFPVGVTCLVGANGAGKSTLFRGLAGLQKPKAGSLTWTDGQAGTVGLLPQEPSLPARARCADLLAHVAWLQGVPRSARADAVSSALEAVGLVDRAGQRIGTLSGGMRRRLAIAQAMVHSPGLLLLDEPTVGLDPKQRTGLRELIGQIGQDRVVLVSTHLLEDVRRIAQNVIVLAEGRVTFAGAAAELASRADQAADPADGFDAVVADLMETGEPA
ncbi:MAG: ATP-binding cassette domain-containing protein [Bifidobacteriaceae bacterium]|jgi:ABC-2 type transport system ATP-binding protein|nr:ATP-binding cassette domain-containing protein [Bifidobacteriaceae bacterium]